MFSSRGARAPWLACRAADRGQGLKRWSQAGQHADGLPSLDDMWVEGPMPRNVPDVALMLDAMAAFTHHDPLSRRVSEQGFQAALRHARPPRRLAFSSNFGLRSIDGEVARITRAGVHCF